MWRAYRFKARSRAGLAHTANVSVACKSSFAYKQKQVGLYDPTLEKDACGVGFVANLNAVQSPDIVRDAITALRHMNHR